MLSVVVSSCVILMNGVRLLVVVDVGLTLIMIIKHLILSSWKVYGGSSSNFGRRDMFIEVVR